MHTLLIHQGFASPNEPGGTRHFELARRAVERGHRFTVVASDISYITASRTGSVKADEMIEGIRVLRAFTHRSLHGGFIGRLFSFISFAASSIVKALGAGKVDLVMGTSPPIFQAASAWLVAALRRRPLLLEIRDLWPEFAIDMGILKNPVLIRLSRWLERFLYSRATHLLVNSPAYVDYLRGKGVPPSKITLLPNGVDPQMFDPAGDGNGLRRKLDLDGKFVVVYAGAIGPANDLGVLLDAASGLREEQRIRFLIVGDGKERRRLQAQAEAHQLENVMFVGAQPKQEMRHYLASADACVAILQNIRMFRMTYPNKVFDYMAAGRPVLLAIDGVIRQVVEAARAGIYVPPGDPEALAEAVRHLAANVEEREAMSRRGRSYVEKHFNRADQSGQFTRLLEKVAERR
ncbi:MAG TPA: glycosyltransferase family 4 protein [Blastocatellia bacterium]|jgi:glycosyltransferase involved in cell wall biosynthesis|nr:glycosyltransferase family 4 protein [Blastocatellia bacterium]